MKRENRSYFTSRGVLFLVLLVSLAVAAGCAATEEHNAKETSTAATASAAVKQPVEIAPNTSCGRCGMYPANYPRWQSEIIFNDDSMTPFDGCKCMFNFLFAMNKFDPAHSRDDVAVAWVKDFNSGAWINGADAYYVVGSNMMGPMGKELIPFTDQAAAIKFQQEQGGMVMRFDDITPDVLATLGGMGGMKMHM